MFTDQTYHTLAATLRVSHLATGTPFFWNPSTAKIQRISSGRMTALGKFVSISLNLILTVALLPLLTHFYEAGFNMNNVNGLWKVDSVLIGLMSNVIVYTTHTGFEGVVGLLNQLTVLQRQHKNDHQSQATVALHPKTWCQRLLSFDYIFRFSIYNTILSCGWVPMATYLHKCELHLLQPILGNDFVCGSNHSRLWTMTLQRACLSVLQSLFVLNVIGAGAMYVVAVVLTLVSMNESLQALRIQMHRMKFQNWVAAYQQIQLTSSLLNSSNLATQVIPGCTLINVFNFFLAVHIVVHHDTSPPAIFAGGVIVIVGLVTYYSVCYGLFWRLSELSGSILRELKNNGISNNLESVRVLKGFRKVKFSFGGVGYFDKALFNIIAKLILDYSVTILFL